MKKEEESNEQELFEISQNSASPNHAYYCTIINAFPFLYDLLLLNNLLIF